MTPAHIFSLALPPLFLSFAENNNNMDDEEKVMAIWLYLIIWFLIYCQYVTYERIWIDANKQTFWLYQKGAFSRIKEKITNNSNNKFTKNGIASKKKDIFHNHLYKGDSIKIFFQAIRNRFGSVRFSVQSMCRIKMVMVQ